MSSTPPPPLPQEKRKSIFHQLAQVSWLSVLFAFASIIALTAAPEKWRLSEMIAGIFTGVCAILGISSGIAALFGIRRHGKKGLLTPALTGLCIWALLLALAIPTALAARRRALNRAVLAPAVHTPGAERISDAPAAFSFDLPEGYEPFTSSTMPQGVRYAYMIREAEDAGGATYVLLVKPLGGILPHTHLNPQELPAGKGITIFPARWRGLDIDAFRVPEMANGASYVTLNFQVPLRPGAVQFSFGGPASAEERVRAIANATLSSLEGTTNW